MFQFSAQLSVCETCRFLNFSFLAFHHTDIRVQFLSLALALTIHNKRKGGIIRGLRGVTSGRPGACIGVCTGRPLVTESGQGEGTTLQGILGKGTGRFRRYLVLGSLLVTSVTSFKPVQTSGALLEMYSSSFRRYLVPLHTCLSSVIDMCVVTKWCCTTCKIFHFLKQKRFPRQSVIRDWHVCHKKLANFNFPQQIKTYKKLGL